MSPDRNTQSYTFMGNIELDECKQKVGKEKRRMRIMQQGKVKG
jgi:hypothetical protein